MSSNKPGFEPNFFKGNGLLRPLACKPSDSFSESALEVLENKLSRGLGLLACFSSIVGLCVADEFLVMKPYEVGDMASCFRSPPVCCGTEYAEECRLSAPTSRSRGSLG